MILISMGFGVMAAGCSAPEGDDDASAAGDDDATTPPPVSDDPSSPILMISDGGNYRVQFMNPVTRAAFYELDLTKLFDECNGVDSFCAMTEIHHTVHDGRDYLDMNLGQVDQGGAVVNPATIRRVRLSDPPELVYTLRNLDFSSVPGGQDICDYDPADPCAPGNSPYCSIEFPHDLDVLADDPENGYVELLITDLADQRVLKVNLDYRDGNTCGKVDWVLDHRTEGWGALYLPNDADYFEQDGAQYLLTSYYSATEVLGTGLIELWKRSGEGKSWGKVWTYPDPASSDMPYLNTPHAPILYRAADGSLMLRYGHSRGDGSFWRAGYQGAIGAAVLPRLESAPEYLYESMFPDGDPLTPTGFIRDVEPTSDGRLLISDSGCEMYFNCPLPGRIYLIEPEAFTPMEGASGAWTPDRSEQNFVHVDMTTLEPFVCGYSTVYESDFLTLGELGDDLRARWHDVVSTCPAQPSP
jgi:hypothetical protein